MHVLPSIQSCENRWMGDRPVEEDAVGARLHSGLPAAGFWGSEGSAWDEELKVCSSTLGVADVVLEPESEMSHVASAVDVKSSSEDHSGRLLHTRPPS